MDYKSHSSVLKALQRSQEADKHNRDKVREVRSFLHTEFGQWEQDVYNNASGRPRYQFDVCSQRVDDLAGEMESAQFSLKVRPAGSDASEDIAELYDGIIRNIENMSEAKYVYNDNGRRVVESGFGAWRVIQDYADNDSFDQDLLIRDIKNAVDCVWFDENSRTRTHSDAQWCVVLKPYSRVAYKSEWPDGSGTSVGRERDTNHLEQQQDDVVIGEILYFVPERQRIVRMSNGAVYADDGKLESILDEFAEAGVTVEAERTRTVKRVKSRLFDGGDWLSDEADTVFCDILPVVPVYGNFEVIEDQTHYYGAIEKLIDAQRVYNYTESRKVEEVALSPRKKIFMSLKQAQGHEAQISEMNHSSDPVQFYNPDAESPPPFELGGPQINPGLSEVSQSTLMHLRPNDARAPGQALGLRSGTAVQKEENAEDTKDTKYFSAVQRAIHQTGKLLVKAIPKVYDTERTVRLLSEDGTAKMATINTVVIDNETGQEVEVTDLSRGVYDVTCQVGPQFKNRQDEARQALSDLAAQDPAIIQIGRDVLVKNTPLPGMDIMHKRIRAQMIQQGLVHPDEWTDEERAQMQQSMAQQGQQSPDPMLIAAQAEMVKAQIAQAEMQIKLNDSQTRRMEAELKLALMESERNKNNAAAAKGFAEAHGKMGESGLADMDAATGGVDAYNEVITDHLESKV